MLCRIRFAIKHQSGRLDGEDASDSMLASLELGEKIPPTRPLDLRLSILRVLLCLNHPWSHNQLLNLGKTLVHIRHTRILGTVTARGLGDLD